MSFLTERTELMMEVIAVLVQRLGGSVQITKEEAPGPFNLMTKVGEDGTFHIVREDISHDEVDMIQARFG